MNKRGILTVFFLREGAGKTRGEHDETKLLLVCLHLIIENTKQEGVTNQFRQIIKNGLVN